MTPAPRPPCQIRERRCLAHPALRKRERRIPPHVLKGMDSSAKEKHQGNRTKIACNNQLLDLQWMPHQKTLIGWHKITLIANLLHFDTVALGKTCAA